MLELKNQEKKHDLKTRIFAKLECFNPAGSVKDRIAKAMINDAKAMINDAKAMINDAEAQGLLKSDIVIGGRLELCVPLLRETGTLRKDLSDKYAAARQSFIKSPFIRSKYVMIELSPAFIGLKGLKDMSIFEKHIILYEGKSKSICEEYQNILRNQNIKFKSYATDDQFKSGCCGLNSKNDSHRVIYTYTVIVKSKDAKTAKELISQPILT